MASRRVQRKRGQMGPKRAPKAGTRGYDNQSNPYVSRGMKRPTGLPSWTHNINPPNSGTPSPRRRPSPRTKFDEANRRGRIMQQAGRPKQSAAKQNSRRLKPYKRRSL